MNRVFDSSGDFRCELALPPTSGVTELPLLLPADQAARLEEIARRHGLTIGQMLRRIVGAHLDGELRDEHSAAISSGRL